MISGARSADPETPLNSGEWAEPIVLQRRDLGVGEFQGGFGENGSHDPGAETRNGRTGGAS